MATAVWRTGNSIDGQTIGQREDLADVIARIDPDETPVYSNARKETASAIYFEWQVQELAAAKTNNRLTEGADASYATPSATTRLGNYMQISGAAVSISNTVDVVNKAGREREVAYQKVLKAIEVRRDLDKIIVSDQNKASADPRVTAGLSSWITNVSAGTSASAATGDGTDYTGQTTSGTDRALALSQIDDAMKLAYEDGGSPEMLVLNPTNKVNFSDLSSGSVVTNEINQTRSNPKDAVIIGSVSMYLTDFGRLDVVIDRQLANDRAFLLDPDYYSVCTLPGRNFVVNDIAPTGDAQRFQIITEWGLKVQAPKAHGAVFDLNGS